MTINLLHHHGVSGGYVRRLQVEIVMSVVAARELPQRRRFPGNATLEGVN